MLCISYRKGPSPTFPKPGWFFQVPGHCSASLTLLHGSQFGYSCSAGSFMLSCLAPSRSSIHQGFPQSPGRCLSPHPNLLKLFSGALPYRFQAAGLNFDFYLLGSGVPPGSAQSSACCAGEMFTRWGASVILRFTSCISLPWVVSLFVLFPFVLYILSCFRVVCFQIARSVPVFLS